jgi:hypothetical protein
MSEYNDAPSFSHPQQLRDHLAATIGEEVFQQMSGDDAGRNVGNPYREAPPVAPTQEGQQADPASPPAPVAPAQPVAPALEGQPGSQRLLLGKFKSEPEAEKSYHGLIHANKALLSEKDQLLSTIADLQLRANGQNAPASQAPSQADPVSRSSRRAEIIEQLESNPFDPALVARLTEVVAQETLEQANAPQRAYDEANTYMQARYPEALQFGDEVGQFVATNPETKAAVEKLWAAKAYGEASELAYLRWQIQKAGSAENSALANAQVLQEEVAKARIDAGLVTSQANGVHETPASQIAVSQEEEAAAIKQYHAGYKQPLMRIIGRDLPDDLFGPNA